MERFCPQKDWQSFCRGMVTNGMHPEKDIVMGRAPGLTCMKEVQRYQGALKIRLENYR